MNTAPGTPDCIVQKMHSSSWHLIYIKEQTEGCLGNPGELTEPCWWRHWRWKWCVVFGPICSPQKFIGRIGRIGYVLMIHMHCKIAIWRMHYTQLESVKQCYLYADWWERVGCNVMYWPWHGCPRRISQKWDNKGKARQVYLYSTFHTHW